MIQELTKRGICVSLGKGWGEAQSVHVSCSMGQAAQGCDISNGASVWLGWVVFPFVTPFLAFGGVTDV